MVHREVRISTERERERERERETDRQTDRQTDRRTDELETCPYLQFASLYDGHEVFVWSDCMLDLGTDFLVGNMVFV